MLARGAHERERRDADYRWRRSTGPSRSNWSRPPACVRIHRRAWLRAACGRGRGALSARGSIRRLSLRPASTSSPADLAQGWSVQPGDASVLPVDRLLAQARCERCGRSATNASLATCGSSCFFHIVNAPSGFALQPSARAARSTPRRTVYERAITAAPRPRTEAGRPSVARAPRAGRLSVEAPSTSRSRSPAARRRARGYRASRLSPRTSSSRSTGA